MAMKNRVDDILKELGLFNSKTQFTPPPAPKIVQRERGPCGKVVFTSEGSAKNGARAILRKGSGNTSFLRTYFCDECRGWHMSSSYFGEYGEKRNKRK